MENKSIANYEEMTDPLISCYSVCLNMIRHCVEKGGKHAEPEHLLLLIDCADICQATASFMFPKSNAAIRTAQLCAQICDSCAESCEQLADDEEMKLCAEVCRDCANHCRNMAGMEPNIT